MMIALIVVAALTDIAGLIWSKRFGDHGGREYAAATVMSFAIGSCCWLWLVRHGGRGVAITGVMWAAAGTLIGVAIGWWSGEPLTATNWIGIIAVAVGMVLAGS